MNVLACEFTVAGNRKSRVLMASGIRGIVASFLVQSGKKQRSAAHFKGLERLTNKCIMYSTASHSIVDAGQPSAETHPQLVAEGEITPGITEQEYRDRRAKLLQLLPEKSLVIIPSAPVKMMTNVVPYPFRQDADYSYFTGCQQPGGVAVLSNEVGLCMFMPGLDSEKEVWWGKVADSVTALHTLKADQAYSIEKLHEILPDMISKACHIYHNPRTGMMEYTSLPPFQKVIEESRVLNLERYTHEVRWVKSANEISLMRQSAAIASQALLKTMFVSKEFPSEHVLAATIEYECKIRGGQRMAFTPVVGGGSNATVIHYSRNDNEIKEGEMVLMDVGCEFHGYVSDLTRTWPPCGTFSPPQWELYDLVLNTSNECLKLCKPGASLSEIHSHSVQLLRKGLMELGILKKSLLTSGSFEQFNPTSIGHYLGMDVHDCSSISYRRLLQPGVVITIEPGIYIPVNSNVPERFRGIGIRIEDEVLITDNGYEVLTSSVPKEKHQIESLLS